MEYWYRNIDEAEDGFVAGKRISVGHYSLCLMLKLVEGVGVEVEC